jgi:predicted ATPase
MSARSDHTFNTTALDPDLLASSFGVQTNWHVITGAPCSGKTTLIDLLAERGFRTVPEAGRLYVEREMAKGRTPDELRADGLTGQRRIAALQVTYERKLQVDQVAFLDRGVPDGLTYCRFLGFDPNSVLGECFRYRYASVLILDRFPFQWDGLRFEDDASAGLIDEWLVRDYSALGYSVVRVPVLPIPDRVAYILDMVSE